MNFKWLKLLVIIAVLVLVFSISFGCKTTSTQTTAIGTTAAETTAAVQTTTAAETTVTETTAVKPVNLVMWWWGDQENPGSEDWLKESIELYKKIKPNVTIDEVLQSTEGFIPAWKAALLAKDVPDIQYLWAGTWTLDDVWAGNIAPLSDYWDKEELSHLISPVVYENKIWAATWYTNLMTFVYNKKVLKACGIDPNITQLNWQEFIDICQKVKDAGYTPFTMGLKKQSANWYFTQLAKQNFSNMKEILAPIVGKADWSENNYSEWLYKFKELWDKGFIRDDAASQELYVALEDFTTGKYAFTVAVSGTILSWAKQQLMDENDIGIMIVPKYGNGAYANTVSTGTMGLAIPALAKNKEEAAEFLKFLHTEDRLNAYYNKTGAIVADDRMDQNLVTSPLTKEMYNMIKNYGDLHWGNLIPPKFSNEGIQVVLQLILANGITIDDGIKKLNEVMKNWRESNPDGLQNYMKWYESY